MSGTAGLAARGATPAAFGRRCIAVGCVAPPSNTPGILSRRALPTGRLAALGATLALHHGLLGLVMVLAAATACSRAGAGGGEGELLPGRTRPVLEHTWRHPRDLQFAANQFQPADPGASLVTTAAGLRAYVIPGGNDRVVQIVAALPIGRMTETANEIGAAEFLSRVLQRGIDDRLGDGLSARLQVDQDVDLTRITLQVLPDDWRAALGAVIDGLRQPPLDQAAIAGFRTGPGFARQTRGLGGAAFRPAVELARLSGGYPLAPPDPGRTLQAQAVLDFASRTMGPQSIVLGIGGKVARPDVERALQELTSGWAAQQRAAETPPPVATVPTDPAFQTIDEPGYTTWVAMGHAVPRIAPEHEAAVAVLTEILNIRLNIAAREIRGLANQTVLHVPATVRQPGLLHVRTGARPESIAPLIHFSKQELSRIRDQAGSPTDEELEQVKGGLVLSQWQRSLDGARATAATYAAETVRHGGLDRLKRWPEVVRAVTAADVRTAATTYIHPEKLGVVIIGQLEAVRKARHPRWPVSLDDVMPAHQKTRP